MAYLINMVWAYAAFMVCRVVYVALNWTNFHESLAENSWTDLLTGCWMFDTSALLYINALYLLLMLLPLHLKENISYHRVVRTVYLLFNGIGIFANLADAVYFPYTGRRTTATLFSEFSNENNLSSILGTEVLNHWYLIVLFILMIWSMYKLYCFPIALGKNSKVTFPLFPYYIGNTLLLAIMAGLSVAGMRGGFTTAVRPITISNANQYVNRPAEAAIVLNTPFSIFRTLSKKTFIEPEYFDSIEDAEKIFSPEHYPTDTLEFVPRNVVVIIGESLGREYIGALNDLGQCKKDVSYTPFLDSICRHAFTTDWSFCNGRKSIDGMPSILSGIPMFVEPFFLTPASLNDVGGLARSLSDKGYETAFFHGAQNGSMGFQAFSRTTGFQKYFGRTEYNNDPRFGGDKDFDGTWAVWDEPFLQFYGTKMSELQEPFMTAVFTASSHHPYIVPEAYRDTFPEEGVAMHKCIRYLDHSLRRFFELVCEEPWYKNTIFVITGDHTNLTEEKYYQTDLGYFGSPFIIFDPTGELVPAQRRHAIGQQIDVMPTVLSALHYDQPYVAFGCDLLTTPDSLTWHIDYNNGIYQYAKNGYLLQFDGEKPTAFYDLQNDWYQNNNLLGKEETESLVQQYLQQTKAIIQSYMHRMNNNQLMINGKE